MKTAVVGQTSVHHNLQQHREQRTEVHSTIQIQRV